MANLLLMGPISPPYTGQSVAFTAIVEYYRHSDNRIIEINLSNRNSIISGLSLCLKVSFTLLFTKIDIIYFTCSRSFLGSIRDIVLLFWARLFKVKVINHLHGGDFRIFYENSSPIYKKILRWAYNGVDTSIVLFNGMKNLFEDFPEMQVKTIANSYSLYLDKLPKYKPNKDSVIRILYLSNIMKSKGILNLLDSFDNILKKYSNVQLTVAGEFIGDYIFSKEEIERAFSLKYNVLKNRYKEALDYVGVKKGDEKKVLLWESDVFILPTYHKTEAFPISILEALRAGNYIISTNHNYIPEIISSANGELVVPNSTKALVQAIENIIRDREKLNQIQNYNIEYAISNYKEDRYIQGVIQIINENLSNNSYI